MPNRELPPLEAAPETMDELLTKMADYAMYPWLMQIALGETDDARLDPQHAMFLVKLIELAEDGVKNG